MEARYRIGGVFCLLLAGAITWQAVWLPLHDASLGADMITWMPRATVVIGLCLVFGIYFLATGNRYPYRDVERQTLTSVGWTLCVLIGIVALAGFFGMDMMLRSMGYQ
ncbi:hypothetical protein Rleg9DRAFT_6873 [Rhizobium leguminosarum bv. trifolii WSM597]|uniref:Uncharacterized protein n=1 Tax=Rhizobium leguminosarum bv. trifolii WSM597 TaxID=754764 RepID=I9NM27_RHILT|nr:hypothetical protein [Rhizobium leguminosarum]EJB07852.1 hypothetical protein Rleg9DRAFT_6873 [Rhizobium leguminosarum bv. trifolii WSM597]MBB5663000.1 heme/copper-type cytochrome/quinol oxidase subunit 2 [Rhizobium leguminosarum]